MGPLPVTAVLDACVLYPAPLRDLLMWIGLSGQVRVRWSARIHEEWKRNLLANRTDLSAAQLDRTAALMDRAIPDALVTGHEGLIDSLTLPDADDRHVLAAAIHCQANLIVTFNEKDFPANRLVPHQVAAQDPDSFITQLFELDSDLILTAARRQRAQLANPVVDVERYLAMLERQRLVRTAQALAACRSAL